MFAVSGPDKLRHVQSDRKIKCGGDRGRRRWWTDQGPGAVSISKMKQLHLRGLSLVPGGDLRLAPPPNVNSAGVLASVDAPPHNPPPRFIFSANNQRMKFPQRSYIHATKHFSKINSYFMLSEAGSGLDDARPVIG